MAASPERNGGTVAFPNLGKHCSQELCRLLDFLPFRCDACKETFCLEHRSYQSHACAHAHEKDVTVLLCPECYMSFGAKDTAALVVHMGSAECSQRVAKRKLKCPVRGCKEKLTFSNTTLCKACEKKFCLRHRLKEDHSCGLAPKLQPVLLRSLTCASSVEAEQKPSGAGQPNHARPVHVH